MPTIESELSYLADLLNKSSKTTADLGEKVSSTIQSIELPDAFESIEEANAFLHSFKSIISPVLGDLSEVIAASYVDDLGGQAINRIKSLIGYQKVHADDADHIESLLSQCDVDQLMLEHNALPKAEK